MIVISVVDSWHVSSFYSHSNKLEKKARCFDERARALSSIRLDGSWNTRKVWRRIELYMSLWMECRPACLNFDNANETIWKLKTEFESRIPHSNRVKQKLWQSDLVKLAAYFYEFILRFSWVFNLRLYSIKLSFNHKWINKPDSLHVFNGRPPIFAEEFESKK